MKQQALYKILTGMQQDVADSGMDKQHAYDIHNMRLRNSDTNTITALVNEVGNKKATDINGSVPSIKGTVIGFNTLNDTGIIFTHEEDGVDYPDVIDRSSTDIDPNPGGIIRATNHHLVVRNVCSYDIIANEQVQGCIGNSAVSFDATGTADVVICIKKFLSTLTYTSFEISVDGTGFTLIHDNQVTDFLTVSTFEMQLVNSSPKSNYIFAVRIALPAQTSSIQTVTGHVTFHPVATPDSTSEIELVDNTVSFTVTVPAEGTGPEPEDPDEPPVFHDGDVICDYPEELPGKKCDHIYLVNLDPDNKKRIRVFEYFRGNLNFSTEHPIESTVYFENEKVQKVYWVDGVNPLRYANIADKNGTTYWRSNIMFESVPLLHLQEDVTVRRNSTGGVFPSGTVQWCFTYLNRYGAESNIAWISPIHYSSPDDRGGSPEETCSNSFTLTITKYEPNGRFDYIRLYHIVHTTLDTEAEVRRVADIAIPPKKSNGEYPAVVYTDTNTTGEAVDPSELLYLGGISVVPNTIEQKSNTLFLGNLTQPISYLRDVIDDMPDTGTDAVVKPVWGTPVSDAPVQFVEEESNVPADMRSGYYSHQNQLISDSWNITSFRRGEKYRFGFQAQDKTGRWSDVWWLGDYQNDNAQPKYSNGKLVTVHAQYNLDVTFVSALRGKGYRKVRPVVVYPEPWERNIYTEGLINPTVYNVKDRSSNAPYAQSSWFLRPFSPIDLTSISNNGSPLLNVLGNLEFGSVSVHGSFKKSMPFPESDLFTSLVGLSDEMSFLAIDSPFYTSDPNNPKTSLHSYDLSMYGSWAEFRHNHPLGDIQQRNGEIQSMYNDRVHGTVNDTEMQKKYSLTFPYSEIDSNGNKRRGFISKYADFFYVDQNVLTMNSADVEFDQTLQAQNLGQYKLRISGLIPITSFVSSYDILTNTPPNKFYTEENDGLLVAPGLYNSETVGARMEDSGHGWKSMINGAVWHDDLAYGSMWHTDTADYTNSVCTPVGFAVYPWHGSGSLNNDSIGTRRVYPTDEGKDKKNEKESKSSTGDNYISAELKTKILSNLHYSYRTHSVTDTEFSVPIAVNAGIVFNQQTVSLTKLAAPAGSSDGMMHYFGQVDKLITPMSDYFLTDNRLTRKGGYPKMASMLPYLEHTYSGSTPSHIAFYSPYTPVGYPNTLFVPEYTNVSGAYSTGADHNGWLPADMKDGADRSMSSISIRYGSCNHIVFVLGYVEFEGSVYQRCLDWLGDTVIYAPVNEASSASPKPALSLFWNPKINGTALRGHKSLNAFTEVAGNQVSFDGVTLESKTASTYSYNALSFDGFVSGYLYMGQFFRDDDVPNRFGGDSDEALEQNVWLPAGEAVYLKEDNPAQLKWQAGDTYYQRYDALRTFPFSEEDKNKIVDIVSFMTETHVNIDGRYDKNRGLSNNNHCRPQNFNKINYVYSQRDNFFTYQTLNPKKVHLSVFEYSFTWTLSKVAGALRDEWTRITLASSYDCDGNKGPLNRIVRLDNNLVTFQSGGVAQILFNENVQIQGSEGVPIELANSGKMQGLRYYTTETGCQNKWSIAVFPTGIYWIDGRNREFYSLGEGITPIASSKMMSTWFRKRNDVTSVWNPKDWTGFMALRDITTGEMFLTSGDVCLCYDTLLGEFTSFYDYDKTDAMFTLEGTVITAARDRTVNEYTNIKPNDNLWFHRSDRQNNCRFYNQQYPFWIEVICNGNNEGSDYGMDKVFDNMSWRADVWNYDASEDSWQYKPFDTFTHLSGFNDYQRFALSFDKINGSTDAQLSNPVRPINLRKKFKVWHTTMPRTESADNSVFRDRIRDAWCHIRLTADESISMYRHILHDIVITYFIP